MLAAWEVQGGLPLPTVRRLLEGQPDLIAAKVIPQGSSSTSGCAYGADPNTRDGQGKIPADLAREAEAAKSVDRFSQTGPGELAGWLQPGAGCAQLADRARGGAPVPTEETDAAWRAYACTRDAKICER